MSASVRRLVCEAIEGNEVVRFTYGGRVRVVDVYAHGLTSDGHELALCWQRQGGGTSGGGGWRFFRLDAIEDFESLRTTSPWTQPTFTSLPSREIPIVHCHRPLAPT